MVHNVLVHLVTLGSSKMEVMETYFFDMVPTQNDHPVYEKQFLGSIDVFFTLFGCWVGGPGGGGGGGRGRAGGGGRRSPKDWHTTCLCSLSPETAQKWKFQKPFFWIL